MITSVSLIEAFSGMGTLTRALSDGLETALPVNIAACVEIDGRYLAHWSKAHRGASTFLGSFGAYHPAEVSVPQTGCRVFVAGIPCTGTSLAGRAKNRLSAPEEHSDVGYLFIPTAHYIRTHRPDVVVFENVPLYAKTASADALRGMLAASGYVLSEYQVDAFEQFETPTQRKRWVGIASRHGRFVWDFKPSRFQGTLAQFLDAPSARDEADSATPRQVEADSSYLNRKQAAGCGFAMRIIDHDSTKCPTICASYGKRQPSATFVKTAVSYRMLRPREVARIHGFPDSMALPASATTSYEVLGQGVCYRPFRELGISLGKWISNGMNSNQSATEETFPPQGQLDLFTDLISAA